MISDRLHAGELFKFMGNYLIKLQFILITLNHYKLSLALHAFTSHLKHFIFLLWFEKHIQILSYGNSCLCVRYSK